MIKPRLNAQVAGSLKETVGTLKEKVGGIFSERYAAISVQRPACACLGTSRVQQNSALMSLFCCALSVRPEQTEALCIVLLQVTTCRAEEGGKEQRAEGELEKAAADVQNQ